MLSLLLAHDAGGPDRLRRRPAAVFPRRWRAERAAAIRDAALRPVVHRARRTGASPCRDVRSSGFTLAAPHRLVLDFAQPPRPRAERPRRRRATVTP